MKATSSRLALPQQAESFEEFVSATSARLHRVATLLADRPADADDLLQTAYERVYRKWDRIRAGGAPEAYAARVLANLALDGHRRAKRRPESLMAVTPESAIDLEVIGREPSSADYLAVLDRQVIADLVRQLPPRQRTALVLRTICDMSEQQVAEVMDCSVGTVKSTTHRAITALRRSNDLEK